MRYRVQFLWIILPILPLILGFCVLEILSAGDITLLSNAVAMDGFYASDLDLRFFNALIVYAAVALFQVVGCFAVAGFLAYRLTSLSPTARRSSLMIFGLALLILIIVNILARQDGFSGALNLAYRSTCAVLVKSAVAPHVLPVGCQAPGLSHLAWLSLLPYMAGVVAAAAAAAVVSSAFRHDNLAAWADLVEQAFRATAFVLVTSTIAMMLFYHLPLSVVADEDARALISGFAQGMTLFWGIAFTLTLLAVFAPSYLLLSRALMVQDHADEALRKRIADRSPQRQAARVLTMLGPLLVGSSATVVDMITSALSG